MRAIILRRLLIIPASLFFVITLSYLLVELMPGDPALAIAGSTASEREVAIIRSELGLDRPFGERYVDYVGGVLRGDFGRSFFDGQEVRNDIVRYFPASLELMVLSVILAALIGLSLGATAGYFRRRAPDTAARIVITATQAIPEFLIGLLLIFFVFYLWRWAPAPIGRLGLTDTYPPVVTRFLLIDLVLAGDWRGFTSAVHRSVLPVVTLGIGTAAYFAKVARTTIGAAMESRQVQFARACGLSEFKVLQYALLQARTPILTYTAILIGTLVGGASIIETMFSWQGLGQWGLQSIIALDVPAIQGFIIVTGLFTMVVYLVLDLLVALLDPRITHD
ncbi:MAG: ABC transporter permease [Alphaproteobacteria bacterium]|nr:ABC transporter permease [Alphaproteobacteria bacterium]